MEMWSYVSPDGRVEILDTGGRAATLWERQLVLCRSLSLGEDAILLGPETTGRVISLRALDWQGRETALEPWAVPAFSAFLEDTGYGQTWNPEFLWDGKSLHPVERPDGTWTGHRVDVAALLNL